MLADGSIVLCNDDVDNAAIAKGLNQSTYNIEVVEIMPSNFATTATETAELKNHQPSLQSQQYQSQPIRTQIKLENNIKESKMMAKKRPAHMQPKTESQRFYCPRCGKDYSQSKNMRRHFRLECGQEPRYPCPFCKLRYKRNNQLKNHLITRHSAKVKDGNVYLPMN